MCLFLLDKVSLMLCVNKLTVGWRNTGCEGR